MRRSRTHLGGVESRLLAALAMIVCTTAIRGQEAEAPQEASPAAAQDVPTEAEVPAIEDAVQTESDQALVDFRRDVEPILATHCHTCHGPEMQRGGLRLDSRQHAQRGGDSGRPVLSGTPDSNELLARVSSTDRAYRMPKNAPPLSAEEIAVLRRWVAQGTPWSVPSEKRRETGIVVQWIDYAAGLTDRYEPEFTYALPYVIGVLAFYGALLVVLRCQAASRKGSAWTTGRLAGFCRFCDRVSRRELLLMMIVSWLALALVVARGHVLKIEHQLASATTKHQKQTSPWTNSPYGWPPKPIRPDHPKRVASTYYRGNCERNSELFNGGNYLTATFRVSLCDEDHRQFDVGDALPAEGVFVRIEIERAPGTSEQLFSQDLMASVVMVKNFYEAGRAKLKEEPVRLETLEEDQRWVAYVPIGKPDGQAQLGGVIYVYTGGVNNGMLSGSLHYGVQYELVFADGKLSPESALWMDSFGNAAFAQPDPPGKLPYREWFDHRPMPVISGENTKDPKLLGVEQYVEEGLIEPAEKEQDKKTEAQSEDSADEE